MNRKFEAFRAGYGRALAWSLAHRGPVAGAFAAFVVVSAGLLPLLGQDFFPSVDAGQIKLHVRAAPGMRLEETEKLFGRIEVALREVIPAGEIETLLDNIGTPISGINLSLSDGSLISSA